MSQITQQSKGCGNCKWQVQVDHGYSNYTVEGTDCYCLQKAHPLDSFDRWYGQAEQSDFGATCDSHSIGDPIDVDVDREYGALENYVDDDEVKLFLLLLPDDIETHIGI